MSNVKPLGDYILIKKIEKEEKETGGGIIIKEMAQSPLSKAEVISVSPDVDEPRIWPGATILYFHGSEIEVDGGHLLKYANLAAVIEEAEK